VKGSLLQNVLPGHTDTNTQYHTDCSSSTTELVRNKRYHYPRRQQPRWYGFYTRLSVCLSVISQKLMQLESPNSIKQCSNESWKAIYFGVKRSKVKVRRYKNIAGVRLCTLVSAGFLYILIYYSMALTCGRSLRAAELPRARDV